MSIETDKKTHVERIDLSQDIEHRVALASVVIGEVAIRGIAIWRSKNGKLRVYFPSFRIGSGFDEAISLPPDLRTEVEADVIGAYKEAKAAAISK